MTMLFPKLRYKGTALFFENTCMVAESLNWTYVLLVVLQLLVLYNWFDFRTTSVVKTTV